MGSKKTVQSNDPWAPAQPYILNNLQQQSDVFNSSQPALMGAAADQRATYGRVAPGAEQGILGAQGLVNANLHGDNLNGNPHLQGMIDSSNRDITDTVNGQFNSRFGSAYHAKALADSLARNEQSYRFGDYNTERGYQQDAIGQAGGLMNGTQGLLNNAAELPWIGVQAANGAVRQASAGYGTQTTKQSPGLLDYLGTGIQAASLFSDARLKTDIRRVGRTDAGLTVYSYRYGGQGPYHMGVMAQEVEKTQPHALGAVIDGFKTVRYEEVR